MMESRTIAEQHNIHLEQIRTNTTAISTQTNKQPTFAKPPRSRHLLKNTFTSPCQPLNEVWEEVDPGSTPFSHSGALRCIVLHCIHLGSPGLALPSHQVLNHCFRL